MTRTKATVRRLLEAIIPQRIGNNNIFNRRLRNMPFKLKRLMPEMKRVAVKKSGYVIRQKKVRKVSGKRRLNA